MKLPLFYPILDVETAMKRGISPVKLTSTLLDAGARILQFRYKGFFSRKMFTEISRIAELARQAGAIFIVNDRVDVARLLNAGVHLGQDDLLPSDARRVIGEKAIVGFSTHNETQLRAAADQPADYLALGPIFGTASKENPDPVVGLEELARLCSLTKQPLAGTKRPLVAIGGITRANARSVIEAGADSVAVIGDLFPEDGDFAERAREWGRLLGH